MEKKKRRQKSCIEIAVTRARQLRNQKANPIFVGWAFIVALISIRTPIMVPATPHLTEANNDWPISDYERGFSTSPKPHHERYREKPSMKRLMRDLQRPVAHVEALDLLLARIDDVGLRAWVLEQIREGQINRLSIHVHPGLPDGTIIASWQAELDAENTANDEAVNDALQAHRPPSLYK